MLQHCKASYKCLSFLSMVYILILFASAIIGNKTVIAPIFGSFSAASLTGPFWFILSGIIAEVYGWKISLQIFISAMVCEFIFICLCLCLIHLPSPIWWQQQYSYNYIIDPLFKVYIFQLLAITIAWYININLLSKWGILLKGRYFWIRNLGSSGISEVIFSIISVTLNRVGIVPYNEIYKIVIWSCILKLIFIILFSYPSSLIVEIIRNLEKIKPLKCNYNPFNVGHNKIKKNLRSDFPNKNI